MFSPWWPATILEWTVGSRPSKTSGNNYFGNSVSLSRYDKILTTLVLDLVMERMERWVRSCEGLLKGVQLKIWENFKWPQYQFWPSQLAHHIKFWKFQFFIITCPMPMGWTNLSIVLQLGLLLGFCRVLTSSYYHNTIGWMLLLNYQLGDCIINILILLHNYYISIIVSIDVGLNMTSSTLTLTICPNLHAILAHMYKSKSPCLHNIWSNQNC